MADGDTPTGGSGETAATARDAVAFLLPSYKTPLLASELLHAAAAAAPAFAGCSFVLLLDVADPHVPSYVEIVKSVREKGVSAGYIVFDGAPYCGMVNRVAPIVNADTVCVLDNKHLPQVGTEDGNVAAAIRKWLAQSPQQMRVGVFSDDGFFPVVTQKLVERLGYMFHPLCYGRIEAENWLLSVAEDLGVLSRIEDGRIFESPADTVEICGMSDADDVKWVDETLEQTLGDVISRLDAYIVK